MKKIIIFIIIFGLILFITKQLISPNMEISFKDINNSNNTNSVENNILIDNTISAKEVFISGPIPNNVYQNMLGKSIPIEYKDSINLSSFSYLQMSYYGFDNEVHIGEMIVNTKLSEDVLEIFKELYAIKYKIEKIKLIDDYNADDELSMSDNNTSCFCYRVISGTKNLSNHAKGCAIDINPLYNPYVTPKIVSPSSALQYKDRSSNNEHMISKNDELYKIFIKHRLVLGWKLEI